MIGTKGKANYWFGYVHVAWTDERMFSEQKKNSISLGSKHSNGTKQELSGCHHSPQPLHSFFFNSEQQDRF
jgi:hypothetical protein